MTEAAIKEAFKRINDKIKGVDTSVILLELYKKLKAFEVDGDKLTLDGQVIYTFLTPKDGDKGEKGEKGEKGDKGELGKDGKDGKDGKNGLDGKDGINGRDGTDGLSSSVDIVIKEEKVFAVVDGVEKELVSLDKLKGKDGRNGGGRNGKAAYTYAVESGYTGTEQEFAEGLKFINDYLISPSVVSNLIDTTISVSVLKNTIYKYGELTALTVSAFETSDRETIIYFASGAAPTTLSLPVALSVIGTISIIANRKYVISILNGVAVVGEYV